jgi:hypothetical protein
MLVVPDHPAMAQAVDGLRSVVVVGRGGRCHCRRQDETWSKKVLRTRVLSEVGGGGSRRWRGGEAAKDALGESRRCQLNTNENVTRAEERENIEHPSFVCVHRTPRLFGRDKSQLPLAPSNLSNIQLRCLSIFYHV